MSRFASFREFYPFYLSEHRHPVSRRLHFIGSCGVLLLAFAVLLTTDGHPGRRSGAVVLGAVLVLVLTDAVALAEDDGGANIGLGGVRLLALLAVAAVALRLAPAVARDRRSGPSAPRA